MAIRWVISPVVDQLIVSAAAGDTTIRATKAALLIEPGRDKRYQCANVAGTNAFALAMIRASDMSAIGADPDIISLFEVDFSDGQRASLLATTPRIQGWPASRMVRIRDRLTARGVDTTGLTMDSTLEEILDRLVQRFGGVLARHVWV